LKSMKNFGVIALAVLLAVVPLIIRNQYLLHLLILVGIYVLLTQGLNLIFGYLGLLSLGQQAFLTIGAYAAAMLALRLGVGFWLTLPAAIVVTAIAGYLIGYIVLRLRGAYFVIVTIAFAEIVRLLPMNIDFFGGPPGLRGIPAPAIRIGGLIDYSFQGQGKIPYFYLIWIMAGLGILISHRVMNSRQGRAFAALREHEALAESVGINPFKYTMMAFIVSVSLSGAAGAFFAHYVTLVSPELGSFSWTLAILVMVAVGGQGTIWGPVLGAFIFTFLPEWLRAVEELRMPLYGLILMLAVLFFPHGLWSLLSRLPEEISRVRMRWHKAAMPEAVLDAQTDAMQIAGQEQRDVTSDVSDEV
jgi:branched-chain amino acid transport system permease protein